MTRALKRRRTKINEAARALFMRGDTGDRMNAQDQAQMPQGVDPQRYFRQLEIVSELSAKVMEFERMLIQANAENQRLAQRLAQRLMELGDKPAGPAAQPEPAQEAPAPTEAPPAAAKTVRSRKR